MAEQIELQTDRLFLRPFSFEDAKDVVAYANDDQWGRFFASPYPYTARDGEEFVARCVLLSWETEPRFAITLDGRVIGSTGLRVNAAQKVAAVGYGLAREHWGKGLTPEAVTAVIDWAFPTYDLDKVFARADGRNVQSHRVMEKLGMTREACLRKHRLHRGERVDEVWYGLLREEWEGGRVHYERL